MSEEELDRRELFPSGVRVSCDGVLTRFWHRKPSAMESCASILPVMVKKWLSSAS